MPDQLARHLGPHQGLNAEWNCRAWPLRDHLNYWLLDAEDCTESGEPLLQLVYRDMSDDDSETQDCGWLAAHAGVMADACRMANVDAGFYPKTVSQADAPATNYERAMALVDALAMDLRALVNDYRNQTDNVFLSNGIALDVVASHADSLPALIDSLLATE